MQYSKEEEKAMWLEGWRKIGKGAWAYVKANSLNPQTFTKWSKAEAKMNFLEVSAQMPPPQEQNGRRSC